MYSSFDKAIAAVIGAIAYFAAPYVDTSWLTAETIQTIAAALTPMLVWAIPNKAA